MDAVLTELREQWLVVAVMGSVIAWVAVLVTEMPRYRPAIQAVFDRTPRSVVYNLADYSAAELSPFGHGVIGLLDLALEAFTRSEVFAVAAARVGVPGRACGSGAAAISRRKAAAAPPSTGSEPHSALGHAILRSSPSRSVVAMPAMP